MKKLLIIILAIVVIFIIHFIYFTYESPLIKTPSLFNDGFIIINSHSKKKCLSYLPKDYVFLDYIYKIQGCTLSTFHRDVTSSSYIYKSKHPTYTFICYYNKGPLLSICPGSHKQTPFLFSKPKIINSKTNRMGILFNCDLVHAGVIDKHTTDSRYAEQYKIVHKDDLPIFLHLHKINKKKNHKCKIRSLYYESALRKLSLYNSYLTNHVFTKYLQENQHNFFNKVMLFITNKDFYNK